MKTRVITLILASAILMGLFASCKTNRRPFIGEYTYQTDGKLSIGLGTGDVDVPITDKMGQMQIMKADEKGKVTIIKSSIGGDIKRLSGSISGDEITIDEYTYSKDLTVGEIDGKAKINFTAKGKLRDNTIVFDDTYSGFYTESNSGFVGTIRSNDAITLAKLND